MVGVNFKRVTVVEDQHELEEQLQRYSVQNGSQIRQQAMNKMRANTVTSTNGFTPTKGRISDREQVK